MDHPIMQGLMDAAYGEWEKTPGKSYDDFIFDLPATQRMAVLIGNLNYQVENGGFAQWIANGYGEHSQDVRRVLQRIGTRAAGNVENLILIVNRINSERMGDLDSSDTDAQDTAYYKVSDELLRDAEAFFTRQQP